MPNGFDWFCSIKVATRRGCTLVHLRCGALVAEVQRWVKDEVPKEDGP